MARATLPSDRRGLVAAVALSIEIAVLVFLAIYVAARLG
jgi:hypothetical protein